MKTTYKLSRETSRRHQKCQRDVAETLSAALREYCTTLEPGTEAHHKARLLLGDMELAARGVTQ